MELQEVLDLVNQYIEENGVDTTRGACFEESANLYFYLLDYGVPQDSLELVEGVFEVENPVGLKLNFQDLYSDELDLFLSKYEGIIDFDKELELSEAIFEFITEYKPERINDFFLINHGWVEYEGYIIDITKEQFEDAVEEITLDKYL